MFSLKFLQLFKSRTVFKRIFISYILLMLISVAFVGSISRVYSYNILLDEIRNTTILRLRHIQNTIDQEVFALNRVAFQMQLSNNLNNVLHRDVVYSPKYLKNYMDLIKQLSDIKFTQNSISNIWVCLADSKIIVGDIGTCTANLFSKNHFINGKSTNILDMPVSKVSKFKLLGKYESNFTGYQSEGICFMFELPSIKSGYPAGFLLFDISSNAFCSILDKIDSEKLVSIFVLDADDNVIIGNATSSLNTSAQQAIPHILNIIENTQLKEGYLENLDFDGVKYSVVYNMLSDTGFKYISIFPTSYVTNKSDFIKFVTYVIVGISLVFGLIFSYFFSKRLYRPIESILKDIRKSTSSNDSYFAMQGAKDELSMINVVVNSISNENVILKDFYQKGFYALRDRFLNDLIYNKISLEQFKENAKLVELEMPYKYFQVVVFELDDYFENKQQLVIDHKIDCLEVINEIFKENQVAEFKCNSVFNGRNNVICILNFENENRVMENFLDSIKHIKEVFYNSYNLVLTVGIGKVYQKYSRISKSFSEALYALEYKNVKGQGSIIHIDEIKKAPYEIFSYSIDIERKILNLTKAGDTDGVIKAIDEVIRQNHQIDSKSIQIIDSLFYEIAGTALKAIADVKIKMEDIFDTNLSIYEQLQEKISVEEKRDFLIDVFSKITLSIKKSEISHGEMIMKKIKDYIEKNYNDPDISLSVIGDNIGYSTSYLSLIFKEMSGENFVDYINNYRLEKARNLLKKTNLKVLEISQMVGFTNSNTFIKVFKKYEGVTPGQYRSSISNM